MSWPPAAAGVALFAAGAGLTTLIRPHFVQSVFGIARAGHMNGVVARSQQLARAAAPVLAVGLASAIGYGTVFALLAATFAVAGRDIPSSPVGPVKRRGGIVNQQNTQSTRKARRGTGVLRLRAVVVVLWRGGQAHVLRPRACTRRLRLRRAAGDRTRRQLANRAERRERHWAEEAGVERLPARGGEEPIRSTVLGQARGKVDVVELLPRDAASIEIPDAISGEVGDADREDVRSPAPDGRRARSGTAVR